MRAALLSGMAVLSLALPSALRAERGGVTGPTVESPTIIDVIRRFDVNALNMWLTNHGSLAYDPATGGPGLEFPKGTGKTLMYAGGLWLGARVNGEVRTVVAEYSQEFGPGNMEGGTFGDFNGPQFRVYKVVPWTGDPADTGHVTRLPSDPLQDPLVHHGWSEYLAGAAPYGAPTRTWQLPDPNVPGGTVPVAGPDVQDDEMLWAVFNDANPLWHTNNAGSSSPLGVEIQESVHGLDAPGALGSAVIVHYRIINKGFQTLDDMFVSVWTDPDLGGYTDDLVGSVPSLGLVYCYNADNSDQIYGTSPPAVGVLLLKGPSPAPGDTLPATSAVRYINGTDPQSVADSYNYMQGLNPNGSAIIDPTTGQPTTFMHSGDPVQGTGWLDSNPSDRRMMLSSGAFSMAPGDTQDVEFAILVGQGTDRLSSVASLLASATSIKLNSEYNPNTLTNCPRPASYWANQCPAGSGELSYPQVAAIAAKTAAQSLLFDWPSGSEYVALCETLLPPEPADARALAEQEYAAFLANWAAGKLQISSADDEPIRLLEGMPVDCPGVLGQTVGQLIDPAVAMPGLEVDYRDDNPLHGPALTGVFWGGQAFNGGAGFGSDFAGTLLNPVTSPDSFPDVEIRFSHTNTQRAYRYLRLETSDGGSPVVGRAYRYGGFHTVPFQVWDIEHDVQLDAAFVERTVTDGTGTIQPSGVQPASFDSTWAPLPDDLAFGDREYLMILSRPYSDTPKAEFEVDFKIFADDMPALYALWATLADASAVIDDGDRMTFLTSPYSGQGIDTQLLNLEAETLDDPAVVEAYEQIIACLRGINLGSTITNPCDHVTPVSLSLWRADAGADRVTLEWLSPRPLLPVTIERREHADAWVTVLNTHADGSGLIRFVDAAVRPGARYDYRVTYTDAGTVTHAGEVSVTIPAAPGLALSGFVPNPAYGEAAVEFVLPGSGPATLEVFDLQGRRILSRAVGHLGPGRATAPLGMAGRLRAGVYILTLTQGDASLRRKAVLLR